jgi:hypothetical protein
MILDKEKMSANFDLELRQNIMSENSILINTVGNGVGGELSHREG